MADPMTWIAIASIAGAGTSIYSAAEQDKQAEKQEKAQKEALRKQEEEARKKGPEAVALSEEDAQMEEARKRLMRRGLMGTLKTGSTGLGTVASTADTGLKGTLG